MTHVPTSFADDPIVSHSAHFPLARLGVPAMRSLPSECGVRPWGLGGMRTAREQGNDPARAAFHYDHTTQTAVDDTGRTLVASDPSSRKQSTNDGDEGPSEDFGHDFCPDSPAQV